MDVVKRVYYYLKQANCPVYHATSKDLKDYTTTEKDMKRGSSRFPPPNLRNFEEDIFADEEESKEDTRADSEPQEAFGTEEDLVNKQQ